jgi:prepilin-type N-terminal cleavage/methylation domain-containing protein
MPILVSPPPPRRPAPRGFTLIELLIVVVIIGVLSAVAIPRFAQTKGKANLASVRSDLRNMANAQESYFNEEGTYASNIALLNVRPSPGVAVTIVEATSSGWSATAVHPAASPVTCALYYGSAAPAAPATSEGSVACQ